MTEKGSDGTLAQCGARPPRAAPLRIGGLEVAAPVVLAPMAGVTNAPFRLLCREHGPGLFVAEMVTARALVERREASLRMMAHAPGEWPRSVQLQGTDPATVAAAARMIGAEGLADHIDLNFGCPVPKVTRRGGGAALPWKTALYREMTGRAVAAAGAFGIPVTVKLRLGIDAEHLTFMEAGLAAEAEGVAAVTLHARTAAEHYSGLAHWEAIAELKRAVRSIPVLGNGDVFQAEDALAMLERTGCDGVVVGRGCQGRPWLFADLAAALAGSDRRARPGLREVAGVIRRHAELLVEHLGDQGHALREMRGHMAWYLRGYPVGGEARRALGLVGSLAQLDRLLGELDLDAPYPGQAAEGRRGRAGTPRRPTLPEGWLDSREL
ncbi:MAG: tRNA dihydrouridine synthase DusB [Bifidobacteriaceae bacterium]|jgi:nifR3 family TIM-barrel protein|nr:tRNA dihydrouridine synthase DusB [Bifidobacteriaceae bacterium]